MIRWLAGVAMFVMLGVPVHAEPDLRWTPAVSTVRTDDTLTLAIVLDDTITVRTFEVFVEYDPALVSTISGAPGDLFNGFGLFQGFEEVSPQNPGLWHGYSVILGATQWATGPGELFHWTVRGDIEGICEITASEVTLLPPGGGSYPGTTLAPTTLTVRSYVSAVPLVASGEARMAVQPNPFNPRTTIKYELPVSGPVRLAVFDVAGRLIRTLVDEGMSQGSHEAVWDGRDSAGGHVGSGSYLALLEFGGKAEAVRMVLLQ
jgi:hypothetical protein